MEHVGGVIENCATCESNHSDGKEGAELEAEDHAADNQCERDDSALAEDAAKE